MKRLEILNKLINNPWDLDIIEHELNKFSWDYNWHRALLTLKNIIDIFNNNVHNYDYISDWANLIELREDIEYEKWYESKITDLLFILSSPEINWKLSKDEFLKIINNE